MLRLLFLNGKLFECERMSVTLQCAWFIAASSSIEVNMANKNEKERKKHLFSVGLFGPEVEIIVYNTIYLSILYEYAANGNRTKNAENKSPQRNVCGCTDRPFQTKCNKNMKFNLFCCFGTKCECTETGN